MERRERSQGYRHEGGFAMVIKSRFWKLIPTTAVGAVAFTLSTETAQAFFPPLPLGSGPVTVSPLPPVNVPTTPITPVNPNIPVIPPIVPPVPPPPFVPPPIPTVPTTVPPTVPHVCPPTPQNVPEPATLVSGFLGLAVLGGVAWKRRK